jgi:hypothetical protein
MAAFEAVAATPTSQRQFAKDAGVPRATLQYWLACRDGLDASPVLVRFFESPEGLAFIHRLVASLHFVMGFVSPSGLRQIQLVLELAGLFQFVANSYGVHQETGFAMQELIRQFARKQLEALGSNMKPKTISVCEDETFHPAICLVAIEAVSDFILLESYSKRRDGKSWTDALTQATTGLPIHIIQSTSDEGKGLLSHVKEGLGVHHSPDLFHVQHELNRATSAPLAAQVRQAEHELKKVVAKIAEPIEDPSHPRPFGDLGKEEALQQAKPCDTMNERKQAEDALAQAHDRRERAQRLIREIGETYHPVDPKTGALQSADEVQTRLEQRMAGIEEVAQEASLSESSQERIKKARRVVPIMVTTIAFFHDQVCRWINGLGLSATETERIAKSLVPRAYLERVARKLPKADARNELRKTIERMASEETDKWLAELDPEMQARIGKTVKECADLFQRSSSCVEGRNGQLSLRHHSLHRLSEHRLEALTAVHNYFIQRPDGTTAAERFFGAKPDNLFEWLLDHLDVPPRPAMKRTPKAPAAGPPN